MGSLVASPDASSQTTSASTLPGVTWMSHLAGDVPVLAWALLNTAVPTLDATFTTPTGGNVVDTNLRGIVATKTSVTGSESGDVSLSCDVPGANRMAGALALFRGYTGIAQVVSLGEPSGTAVTAHACPTITPTVAGSAFVMVYMDRVTTGNTTATPPAGFTKAAEFGTSGSGGTYLQICYDVSGTRGLAAFTPASWNVTVASTSAIVFLLELPPSGAAFTGTVGLSGAGTLTETGTPSTSGAASLSGSGTLSQTGKPGFAGTTALSGAGTMTTAGQPMLPGNLSLTGGGTLTGLAGNNFAGAANLAGAGALGLAGSPAVSGGLGLSSAGQLAFAATPAFARTVDLTGAGQLALAGAASVPGSLALSGSGALALTGAPAAGGVLVLSGVGALATSGIEAPVGVPGHLVATDSGPAHRTTNSAPVLTAAHSGPTVAATNQPSRLEASHDL